MTKQPEFIVEENLVNQFKKLGNEKINQVNTQLEQTTQYKKGLLQQLFV